MKNSIILVLFTLSSQFLSSQNLCETGGAQGGMLGVTDCYPYDSPCAEEFDAEILLILKTDSNANETSWQIEDLTDEIIIVSGDNFASDTIYQELICAYTDHCYQLIINDSGGDGIDTSQNRGCFIYWNGEFKNSGGNFGTSDTTSFGACCENFSVKLIGGKPCVDYAEGQVQLEIEGGTPPFDYLWSNGATFTKKQFVSTSDGEISVTVTDASGCKASETFYKTSLKSLEIEVVSTQVQINNAQIGTASVKVLSGIPPFKYEWSNGSIEETIANLSPGNYSVTVFDGSGCSVIDDLIITEADDLINYKDLDDRIQLMPNPTNGRVILEINLENLSKTQITVFNNLGEKIISRSPVMIQSESIEFDLSGYSTGVYYFMIIVDGQSVTKKLIYSER